MPCAVSEYKHDIVMFAILGNPLHPAYSTYKQHLLHEKKSFYIHFVKRKKEEEHYYITKR